MGWHSLRVGCAMPPPSLRLPALLSFSRPVRPSSRTSGCLAYLLALLSPGGPFSQVDRSTLPFATTSRAVAVRYPQLFEPARPARRRPPTPWRPLATPPALARQGLIKAKTEDRRVY